MPSSHFLGAAQGTIQDRHAVMPRGETLRFLMHAGFEGWPKSHKYKKYSKNLPLNALGMVRGVVFTCIIGPNIIPWTSTDCYSSENTEKWSADLLDLELLPVASAHAPSPHIHKFIYIF